jgi:PAS domain S-box-containing protein
VAAGTIAAAGLLHWLLMPLVGTRAPYLTMMPAVVLVGFRCGLAPGIVALTLGWLTAAFFFWGPRLGMDFSAEHARASAAYLLVGTLSLLLVRLLAHFGNPSDRAKRNDHAFAAEDLLDTSARLQELLSSLSLSEERYRLLAEALQQFVWTMTPAGEIDYCNEHWLAYSGLSLQETPSRWPELVHPDDRAQVQSEWRAARVGERPSQMEFRIRRALDGQYRWHLSRLFPIRTHAGQLVKWLGTSIDIDDQKRAQAALQQQQEHFRLLAEAIPQIVWTADEQGRMDYFNRRWFDYTGLSQAETFSPAGWTQVIHPDDIDEYRRRWDESVRTAQEFQIEYRFRRASDHLYRWHLGRAVPLSVDGGIAHWFGTCTDIEEQKRAETSVRESEERFRVLANTAPVMIWMSGPDKRRYWFNKPWLEFTGRTLDQESGDGWLEGVHPADREFCARAHEQAFDARRTLTIEFRLRHHDGGYRWILDTGVPRFTSHGQFSGFVGSSIDIHDRKQAEQERDQLLESERAARSEAERASRMKDEFLATLSHELRTPLNAVLGYAQLLLRSHDDPEMLQQGLETIERSAKAQAQLISDMMDVSRIISGKIRLDVQPMQVGSVIEAAIETVRPAATARQIEIDIHLPERVLPVAGDPERLQQVFWNLLSNAVKFTPAGGRVTVSARRVRTNLEVSIADTGQGIAPEFLPYVFERFRQADGSSTRRHGGLGLGLSIVKNIVELHGGTVRAHSNGEGQGSTFVVSLPIALAHSAGRILVLDDAETHELSPLASLRGLKVLVVDDERDALNLVQRLLEPFACEVRTAESAGDAWQMIVSNPPDLLVSDIGMPHEDGYSLIRKVRELPPERGGTLPAIALTAFARSEDRLRALRSGYQAHVSKPVEAPELLSVIAHLAKPADGDDGN